MCCRKTEGQEGTWITDEMMDAYIDLHHEGFAHSFETYYEESWLEGCMVFPWEEAFFGESMFYLMRDASKIALYASGGMVD